MKLIERNSCVISGYDDLEHLYSFSEFPIYMGCIDQPETKDLRQSMDWHISRGSGLIQLKHLIPLGLLYPESHGAGEIGALWGKHHIAFARFLNNISPSSVLEIGGAHGILAKEYNQYREIPWTILEPNPSPVKGCNARYIEKFFDDQYTSDTPFDTVVHSHVFEHIYEPDQFMRHLSLLMNDGKCLAFSLPNMRVMMERKYTNCINFEHTVFLTEPYVEFLLARHGFRLLEKEYFMSDHSIFYSAMRDSSTGTVMLPEGLYWKNKQLYMDYVHYHEELISDLNRKMYQISHPVFIFGAHVFTQYLIAFGLDTGRIVALLDNDPKKWGKRLYGSSLMVQSPEMLRKMTDSVVILKAGVYNQEIKEDILNNINESVIFLE